MNGLSLNFIDAIVRATNVAIVPICLGLACCSTGSQALYIGTLQPNAGTCDPPAPATLEVRNGAILFTPRDGTIILHGLVGTDGKLHAEMSLPGMDRKPYRLIFDAASPQTSAFEGRYITPRCSYGITFRKTPS